MTDHFALLNEARRPWLEPEALREKFLELSSGVHPDRVHQLGEAERASAQERYVALNAAYQCLREPKDRLRHLLELESSGAKDVERVPAELMDFLMAIGEACRQADTLIAEKAKITSPLLQVQSFQRSQERIGQLQVWQQKAAARRAAVIDEVKRMDEAWGSALSDTARRGALLGRLGELQRLIAFFDRWAAQIQERIVQLSF